ncbi:MAG: hypothetical protein JNL87_17725 [Burkholderiaceae bacterium]|nr:hypothetical protein [Burkholderiaceae bacterium]
MAQQYSSKDFFRRMPNVLLARYFQGQGLFAELDFGAMKETQPEALIAAWADLPDERRAALEAELRAVHDLGNKKGLLAIQDAARTVLDCDPDALVSLLSKLAALDDHASQAMTAFLDHRELWLWAERFHHADRLAHWKKRKNLPQVLPAADADSLTHLATLMKDHFTKAEGRGRNCVVEHYRRGDKDYFFAFPEDHAARAVEWVNGAFDARPHNPAFEIVFVYCRAYGTLDLFCRGANKAVVPLQEMFARAILKCDDLSPDPKDQKVYNLNPLMKPGFEFVHAPGGGISSVAVKRLRLSSKLRAGDRVTLEANPEGNPQAIYELLEQVRKALPLHQYHVTQVELSASVWAGMGRPPKKVSFTVTHPNSCSLRHDALDDTLRDMLVASGIEPKVPSDLPPATPVLPEPDF